MTSLQVEGLVIPIEFHWTNLESLMLFTKSILKIVMCILHTTLNMIFGVTNSNCLAQN